MPVALPLGGSLSLDGQQSESHPGYALMPVSAMPWTKCFRARKKTMRIGTIIMVEAAKRGAYVVRRANLKARILKEKLW